MSITAISDADGRGMGAVNAFQDVTQQRLREARYRAIVEDQPEMICRFLPDGTITYADERYCRYFGGPRDEIVGKRYWPLVHPDDQGVVRVRDDGVGIPHDQLDAIFELFAQANPTSPAAATT